MTTAEHIPAVATTRTDAELSETPALIHLLLVEDQPGYVRLLREQLQTSRHPKFLVSAAETLAAAETALVDPAFEVILLDLNLPDSRGLDTVRRVKAVAGDRPLVVFTGLEDDELAMAALHEGAQDYLNKGVPIEVVVRSLRYALERMRSQQQLLEAEGRLKAAQLHLIQAEKMETVGRLAAGVAHEIKNPLAIIQMAVDCLLRRPDCRVGELVDVVHDAEHAVQRAFRITNQLLSFAAPADLARRPEDFHVVLRTALSMVQHEVKRRGLTVETRLADDLPDLLLDRTAMEQAVVNLLTNAAQATPPGGRLIVTTRTRVLDIPGNGVGRRATDHFRLGQRVVICEIEDTGAGIAPEHLPRLFDPFFTTKPQGEGTGLGLGIVRNILELHGGRIELENRAEGGAKATLTLVA